MAVHGAPERCGSWNTSPKPAGSESTNRAPSPIPARLNDLRSQPLLSWVFGSVFVPKKAHMENGKQDWRFTNLQIQRLTESRRQARGNHRYQIGLRDDRDRGEKVRRGCL